MEKQPKIYILNQADFQKLYQQRKEDVKGVPTPAITLLSGKENNVIIKAIAIDKDFLLKGEEEKFFDCLIEHELSEVEFYLKNPEKHKVAIETVKRGEPANPEAHLFALGGRN